MSSGEGATEPIDPGNGICEPVRDAPSPVYNAEIQAWLDVMQPRIKRITWMGDLEGWSGKQAPTKFVLEFERFDEFKLGENWQQFGAEYLCVHIEQKADSRVCRFTFNFIKELEQEDLEC